MARLSFQISIVAALCLVAVVFGLGVGQLIGPGEIDQVAARHAAATSSIAAATALTREPLRPTPTVIPATATAVPQRASPLPTTRPASTPVAAIPDAAALREQVQAAVASLQRGSVEALVVYASGSSSATELRFDLRGTAANQRLYSRSIYQSKAGSQVLETLMIGERSWQRRSAGEWQAAQAAGVTEQLLAFLPLLTSEYPLDIRRTPEHLAVRWVAGASELQCLLEIDPLSGRPLLFRQQHTANKTVLTVKYTAWNTEVVIPQLP